MMQPKEKVAPATGTTLLDEPLDHSTNFLDPEVEPDGKRKQNLPAPDPDPILRGLPSPEFSENHRRMLVEESGISPEIVSERGYRTVTDPRTLKFLGFTPQQILVPTLLLPFHSVNGRIENVQSRPDDPRFDKVKKKTVRYETPARSRTILDVHPRSLPHIGNPSTDLYVTEGLKKGDSLLSHGAGCVISLSGVWNWRGTNDHGGATALPDWESVALKGRTVYLVFDSDVVRNSTVKQALDRLSAFLTNRGAEVRIVRLPDGEGGQKIGADDYLVSGHTLDDLKGRVEKPADPEGSKSKDEAAWDGIPFGFRLKENGLYAVEMKEDDNGIAQEIETRIGAPIYVQSLVRNKMSEDWGRVLLFSDPDGVTHRWVCPASLLGADTSDFHRELARLGYILGAGSKTKRLLEDCVKQSHPKARVRCVSKLGWHDGAFVLPNTTYSGKTEAEQIVFQSEHTPEHFTTAGTLDKWRENVGSLCIGNSRLLFTVSVAFAAPLLSLVDGESAIIHLFGGSSSGKTTCIRAGVSVWGPKDYLRSWRTTDNGLEGILTGSNDCLTVFDELGQSDPKISGPAAYMIANGQAKSRATRTGGPRKIATWTTLALSTGEVAITSHMADGGHRPKAGMLVRFLDIPAEVSPGTVYEDLHGSSDGAAFADRLKSASESFYGMPIRAFLETVAQDVSTVQSALRESMTRFVSENLPGDAEGQVRRVAERFALIACAGELATLYGITGWLEGEAERAASTCFLAWLDQRGGSGNREREALLSQVQAFFETHGSSRFEPFDVDENTRIPSRVGFRKTEGNDTTFYVLTENFRSEVIKGFEIKTATRFLIEAGWLVPDSEGKSSQREYLPGLGRKRVYKFNSDVFGKED